MYTRNTALEGDTPELETDESTRERVAFMAAFLTPSTPGGPAEALQKAEALETESRRRAKTELDAAIDALPINDPATGEDAGRTDETEDRSEAAA